MAWSRATPSAWPIRALTRWGARRRRCSRRCRGATAGTPTRRCGGGSSRRRSCANASRPAKISAAVGLCLGAYSRWSFFGLAIVGLFVLRSMVVSARSGDRFRVLALALVCAGAVGNVIDRVRSAQGVVDFVDVGIGGTRWPTFNVADSAITVGAIALAVSLWLEGRAQERAKEAGAAQH